MDDAKDLDLIVLMYNLLEYSSNYSDIAGSLWFYSKDEVTNFNAEITDDKAFKSFIYQAKLLENTEANGANGILKSTSVVPLKYLNNFWRSFKTPLINWKVELKLKWTSHCVLSVFGADNVDANSNNITFTIKNTKLYVPRVNLSAKNNQKLLNKEFEKQCIGMNTKQKVRIKSQQTSIDIFSNQTV